MQPSVKPFAALRRLMRAPGAVEYCEFCHARLAASHAHILVLSDRQLACACGPCAVLFSGAGSEKYRRVPQRTLYLRDFDLGDAHWESLAVPIGLAFFVRSPAGDGVTAFFPSPAGATQCSLDSESWNELARDHAVLDDLQPDVEALLVNRIGGSREYYVAPIDECYRLVGIIRSGWRGLSGGAEVQSRIQEFFRSLKGRAVERRESSGAGPGF